MRNRNLLTIFPKTRNANDLTAKAYVRINLLDQYRRYGETINRLPTI